nr:MAG TPA: hypothetical protein [Caudoviricetes sp.]
MGNTFSLKRRTSQVYLKCCLLLRELISLSNLCQRL